jgi:hypothetical protein
MGPMMNVIIGSVALAATVAGGSLAWPRFTTSQRPKLLQDVHDIVLQTPIGARASDILGVSDEASVEPFNIGQVVYSLVDNVKAAVGKRAQNVIVKNAVKQLEGQFDRLSPEEKTEIRQAICEPLESTQSSSVSGSE